ncbi:hypothetical protein CQW23_01859 [Capsicum baccatum]|uniref:Uncharacterized protein n=1 Tax=Capsicum baccatum TaxID=33114 RepID=A0A2G2XPS0_CAPBA|nr:hypothetical protein CQW23_01859 [Capsicum baccatum]
MLFSLGSVGFGVGMVGRVIRRVGALAKISAFGFYIWCAAADPEDPGVFKSKKYLKKLDKKKQVQIKESKLGCETNSSIQDANATSIGENASAKSNKGTEPAADHNETEQEVTATRQRSRSFRLLALLPCALISNCAGRHTESSQHQYLNKASKAEYDVRWTVMGSTTAFTLSSSLSNCLDIGESKEEGGMKTAKLKDEKEVLDRQQLADIDAQKNLIENLQ